MSKQLVGSQELDRFCKDLNLDQDTTQAVKDLWKRTSATLCTDESEDLHAWLACTIYVAGRRIVDVSVSPTSFSVNSLLRLAGLIPINFYQKLLQFGNQAYLLQSSSSNERLAVKRHAQSYLHRHCMLIAARQYFFRMEKVFLQKQDRKLRKAESISMQKMKSLAWLLVVWIAQGWPDKQLNLYDIFLLTVSCQHLCLSVFSQGWQFRLPSLSDFQAVGTWFSDTQLLKQAIEVFQRSRLLPFLLEHKVTIPVVETTLIATLQRINREYEATILENGLLDERLSPHDLPRSTRRQPKLTPLPAFSARNFQLDHVNQSSPKQQKFNSLPVLRQIIVDHKAGPTASTASTDRFISEYFKNLQACEIYRTSAEAKKRIRLTNDFFHTILSHLDPVLSTSLTSRNQVLTALYAISLELLVFTLDDERMSFPWSLEFVHADPVLFSILVEVVVHKVSSLLKLHVKRLDQCRWYCVSQLVTSTSSSFWPLYTPHAMASTTLKSETSRMQNRIGRQIHLFLRRGVDALIALKLLPRKYHRCFDCFTQEVLAGHFHLMKDYTLDTLLLAACFGLRKLASLPEICISSMACTWHRNDRFLITKTSQQIAQDVLTFYSNILLGPLQDVLIRQFTQNGDGERLLDTALIESSHAPRTISAINPSFKIQSLSDDGRKKMPTGHVEHYTFQFRYHKSDIDSLNRQMSHAPVLPFHSTDNSTPTSLSPQKPVQYESNISSIAGIEPLDFA